eukprot:TRINITY_DN7964_c2_g1_i2.p3 TRINITY_DN7964_c2_g1~~TRINITY_DN7964_c2_g1_i2.p3  ORF type:complete len:106 (+),score=1.05 TRINITY_DN7964_c2_g1_i2:621-938(+)
MDEDGFFLYFQLTLFLPQQYDNILFKEQIYSQKYLQSWINRELFTQITLFWGYLFVQNNVIFNKKILSLGERSYLNTAIDYFSIQTQIKYNNLTLLFVNCIYRRT